MVACDYCLFTSSLRVVPEFESLVGKEARINHHLLFSQQSELEIDTRTFIDVLSTERSKLNTSEYNNCLSCLPYGPRLFKASRKLVTQFEQNRMFQEILLALSFHVEN